MFKTPIYNNKKNKSMKISGPPLFKIIPLKTMFQLSSSHYEEIIYI